ncbi:hypothetical protein [Roseomonas populi]|uniref:Uncharacterized protein n=1 Tax=Roseomonas populi TaxID=3121582 RepID=A0ABT1X048_9PROT|nr:hypothetical protein [Roseomonas pecuniae]MCR0981473.1 hypothetical protein [Roseomonas pecuniae]
MSPEDTTPTDTSDLDAIIGQVLDRMLADTPPERRDEILARLRAQLSECLAEAPIEGEPVDAIAVRARLAAAFEKRLGQADDGEGQAPPTE